MSQSIPEIVSERASRQAIAALSIGHFSIDFWQGCFPAITALLAVGRGYSYTTVGILVLAFNLASSVIQPVFGRIADKRSAQWLMAFGLSIASIGVILIGILRNELLLCLSAMIAGVGVAAFHPEAARLVRAASTGNHATSMSFFSTGGALGFACGPLLASWLLTRFGVENGAILLLVPSALMVWFVLSQQRLLTHIHGQARTKAGNLGPRQSGVDRWNVFAWLLVSIWCRSVPFFAMSAFLPLFWIRVLGGSEATGGQLVSLLFGSGVLGGLAGGWLADRLGHRKIIILSFGVMAAAILLISQQKVPAVILICTVLVGFCLYAPFSVMVVLGQEYVPNHVGLVSGIVFGLSTTIGGAFTPLLGWFADRYGIPAMFTGMTALPCLGMLGGIALPKNPRNELAPLVPRPDGTKVDGA
jgi:MFS transporter, FSR family, fosmidomycin resistance protein